MLGVIPAAAAKPAPWWQAETAMGTNGTLRLDTKPWWERATALKAGEQFSLAATKTGGMMLVRKEQAVNPAHGQMIVWILDDDGDMDANNPRLDTDSDCYVVDYNGDGTVDRMVDYIDNNHDNIQDEMEIRFFRDSQLRYAWFAFDLDGDGHTWYMRDYEVSGLFPFFRSDPYGNNLFFLNKFNPIDKTWIPFSECPFAFHDNDGDGQSEVVARFSAVPRSFMKQNGNPDYANRYQYMYGPFTDEMRDMGVVNLRYSFDIDGLSDAKHPLHYEMGFNMVGDLPYHFRGMAHPNALRREPQTANVAPFDQTKKISETYPADETGFSFMEFEDGAIQIGDPAGDEAGDRRWEGVFWMWNRRLMHNTGGPTQFWNIRREWSNRPATRREVYYSPVDRRLHLKGASEGWIRIGKIADDAEIGEVHMYDADRDGYFDRWEYFETGKALPVRVDRVTGAKNIDFGDNWAAMRKFYTEKALPEALRLDQAIMDAVAVAGAEYATPVAENLKKALERELSPTERRYILDLIRENAYRHWREVSLAAQEKILNTPAKPDHSYSETNVATAKAWLAFQMLAVIDDLYAQGKFAEVAEGIKKLKATK
ncbi:hypothetical protein LLG95_06265 [bacterium]|nr:hypothetical protein [bacterium]